MKHLYKIIILLLFITNIGIAQNGSIKLFSTLSHYNGIVDYKKLQGNGDGAMIYLHTHTINNIAIGVFYAYNFTSLENYKPVTHSYIAFTTFYEIYHIQNTAFIAVKTKINDVTENSRENKYEPTICGGLIFTYDRYFFKPLFKIDVTPKSITLTTGIGIGI